MTTLRLLAKRDYVTSAKIGRKVVHPTGNNETSFNVKGQRSVSAGRLMLI